MRSLSALAIVDVNSRTEQDIPQFAKHRRDKSYNDNIVLVRTTKVDPAEVIALFDHLGELRITRSINGRWLVERHKHLASTRV